MTALFLSELNNLVQQHHYLLWLSSQALCYCSVCAATGHTEQEHPRSSDHQSEEDWNGQASAQNISKSHQPPWVSLQCHRQTLKWQQTKRYSIKTALVKHRWLPSDGHNSRKIVLEYYWILHSTSQKSLMTSKIKEQPGPVKFTTLTPLTFKDGKKYFPQGRGAQLIISGLNPLLLAAEWNY